MDLRDVFVPYDSPIDVIFNRTVDNIMSAFNKSIDDGVVECVVKAGFNVDKDKLVEVFTQDKRRYEEAYRKGYAQRDADIIRCKDCKYAYLTYDGDCKYCDMFTDDDGDPIERYHPGDWFCADGERKDGEQE